MTTQSETIIWHKYPEEKPSVDEQYLIQWDSGGITILEYYLHSSKPEIAGWYNFAHNSKIQDKFISAWAAMPKGWKE